MDCLYRSFLIATVIVFTLFNKANGYSITVDAHAEECFYENVEADTKMGKFNTTYDTMTKLVNSMI